MHVITDFINEAFKASCSAAVQEAWLKIPEVYRGCIPEETRIVLYPMGLTEEGDVANMRESFRQWSPSLVLSIPERYTLENIRRAVFHEVAIFICKLPGTSDLVCRASAELSKKLGPFSPEEIGAFPENFPVRLFCATFPAVLLLKENEKLGSPFAEEFIAHVGECLALHRPAT